MRCLNHVSKLITKTMKPHLPVYEHQKGEATQPPGQSGGRVPVQVLGRRTREQEDLGGLLVGELGGLDRGGVVVNFRLAVKRHNCVQMHTLYSLLPLTCTP